MQMQNAHGIAYHRARMEASRAAVLQITGVKAPMRDEAFID